jgi:hypothetical protein
MILKIRKMIHNQEVRVKLRFILEKTVRFHKGKPLFQKLIRILRIRKTKDYQCKDRGR